jgi:glycosyltransferase involved in cell wall biosynthesis
MRWNMKILHISLSKGWYGGERQTWLLLQGLQKLGIEIELLARSGEPLEAIARKNGITTFCIKKPYLTKSLILSNYDLIHTHEGRGFQFAIIAKFFHGKKVILTRRINKALKKNPITRFKYKACDHIISVSDKINNILSLSGIDQQKLTVIKDAVITEDLSNQKQVDILTKRFKDKIVIGCVANLIPPKGHQYLLEATKILNKTHENIIFVLLGDGPLRNELEAKAKEMNLNNVLFEGYIENPYSYFKIFDIFTLTSTNEGLGSSILDSFFYKVPVVATDAGGIPELVIHNKTGYLSENKNPEDIAAGIIKILNEKEYRESCVDNAYKLLIEKHTVESMSKKYIEAYEKVINKNS